MQDKDLEKYRKKAEDSLRVPGGYFGRSRLELLGIPERDTRMKTPVRQLLTRDRIAWYAAVAAALVLGIFLFINETSEPVSDDPFIDIATITDSQIEQYLLEEYDYSLDDPTIINEVNFVNLREEEWTEDIPKEDIERALEGDMDDNIFQEL